MAQWRTDNSMLTVKGVEILNKMKLGNGSINITKIVVGSGRVAESQLFNSTAVKGTHKTMIVSNKKVIEAGSEIDFYITNEDFTELFEIHQIGIYVTHSDYAEEQLYYIAQCDEDDFDTLPPFNITPIRLDYSLLLEHSNSSSINVSIDPLGAVDRATFEAFQKEIAGQKTELLNALNGIKTSFSNFKSGVKESKLVTADKYGNLIASGIHFVSGTSLSVKDAIDFRALSLSIEGKSTQEPTPTPSAPVYLTDTKVDYIRNFNGSNAVLIDFPSKIVLRSLGDYKDTIEWDGAKWWKVQRIQEVVVDGTTNKVYHSDGVIANTYCNLAFTKGSYNLIKDHIPSAPIKASHGNASHPNETAEFYAFHYSSNGAICGHFLNTVTGVVSTQSREEKGNTINEWLKAQNAAGTPLKVWYVLSTPIVTEITLTDVLEMHSKLTELSCTAEGGTPTLRLGYVINTTDPTIMYILKSLTRKTEVSTANVFAVANIIE